MRFSQSFDSVVTGSVAGGVRSAADAMQIARPPAGSVQVADVQRAFAIKFGFDLSDVKIAAVDVDLVLLFPDGGKLVLPGMALNLLSADPPRLAFNNVEVEPAVMMAQLGDIKLVDQVLATSLQSGDAGKENDNQGSGEAARTQAPLPTMGGVGNGQANSKSTSNVVELPTPTDFTNAASSDAVKRVPTASAMANRPKYIDPLQFEDAVLRLRAQSTVRLFGITDAPDVAIEGQTWVITNSFAAKPADTDSSLSAQTKTMSVVATDHNDLINAADFSRVGSGKTIRRVEFETSAIGAEATIASSIRINLPAGFRIEGMTPITASNGKDYYEFYPKGKNVFAFNLIYDLPGADEKLGEGGYYDTLQAFNFQMIMPPEADGTVSVYYGTQYFVIAPRGVNSPQEMTIDGQTAVVLWSNPPDVEINAGRGDDTIMASASADLIDGGDGYDIVSYAKSHVAVRASLVTGGSGGYAEGDRYQNVEGFEGSDFADRLTGDAHDNYFRGGKGADTIDGGDGRDLVDYSQSTKAVSVDLKRSQQLGGEAQGDVLLSIEDVDGSAFGDFLAGNAADNKLAGHEGDDTLNGDAGNDTLDGGSGNDTADYGELGSEDSVSVTLNGDKPSLASILRNGQSETDTLIGIENLIGGAGNDKLTGDANANNIQGGAGNDTISGGAGDDTLDGGAGYDTVSYAYLGSTQRLSLTLTDTDESYASVYSALNLELESDTLRNIENVIGGAGADTIIGNSQSNILIGGAGDDLLEGRGGGDTLDGGDGVDTATYRYLSREQNLSVTLSDDGSGIARVLGNGGTLLVRDQLFNIENLEGGSGDDTIVGNAGANVLDGGAGNDLIDGGAGNDTLIGNEGADTLRGGAGDDVYIADNADLIIEAAGGGLDTVVIDSTFRDASYTLGANIEVIDASRATRGLTLSGNNTANTIIGSMFDDTLDGGADDDQIDGGKGNDFFLANDGNDTFIGGDGIDTISYAGLKAGFHIEMVRSYGNLLVNVVNAANQIVETDVLTGIEIIIGTGGNDLLLGSAAANTLIGGEGDDTLDGGLNADYLVGGAGNDIYRIDNDDDVFEADGEGIDTIEIGTGYSLDAYTLGANLEIIDARNASKGMRLFGNAADNTIIGSAFADTMAGGIGNDVYFVGQGDIVIENYNEGIDGIVLTTTYLANEYKLTDNIENLDARAASQAMRLVGTASDNIILGGSGDDTLIGFGGNDLLDGGNGNDTADFSYLINSADAINANLLQGRVTVGANLAIVRLISIENLTGGAGNDSLTGDNGANILIGGAGADTLDGGAGIDTLIGGIGNDVYYVDNASDVIVENFNEGTDTVITSSNYTLTDNLENLSVALGVTVGLVLTGNSLNNSIVGGNGNDTLNGGGGVDTLVGGLGDDVYNIASACTIVESANAGIDIVNLTPGFSGRFTLSANIEHLSASGLMNGVTLVGNELNNSITGGSGADTLMGGLGNDTLDGGAGIDTADFSYLTSNQSLSVDLSEGAGTAVVTGGTPQTVTLLNIEGVIGGAGNDTLVGSSESNIIDGGDGNDLIIGGGGNDTIDGGAGTADTLYLTGNLADYDFYTDAAGYYYVSDRVAGRDGTDRITNIELISTADWRSGRSISLLANRNNLLNLSSLSGPAIVIGGTGSDTILGGVSTDYLVGSAGNDSIVGNNGADTIYAGEGDDTVNGGAGGDIMDGGTGTNTLSYAFTQYSNNALVSFDSANKWVTTSATISGGVLNASNSTSLLNLTTFMSVTTNYIFSFDYVNDSGASVSFTWGGQTFTMATGAGTLIGRFTYSSGNFIWTLNTPFTGTIDNFQLVPVTSGVNVDLNNTTTAQSGGDAAGDIIKNFQNVIGSIANDRIIGNSENNYLDGNLGSNYIDGGAGNDDIRVHYQSLNNTLLGGSGNDTIVGSAGNDTMNGGLGNDWLDPLNSFDRIEFDWSMVKGQGWGQDTITGVEVGADKIVINNFGFAISSQSDLDEFFSITPYNAATPFSPTNPCMITLKGAAALGDVQTITITRTSFTARGIDIRDFLFANSSNTWIVGSSSHDALAGTTSDDTIAGLAGNDTLTGLAGNDILDGGSGDDSLDGGDGNDTLISGTGIDRLFGGNGNDVMIMDFSKLTNGSYADGGSGNDVFQLVASTSVTTMSMTMTQLNTLLDNTETLDFTAANNKVSLSINLANASTDRAALNGIAGGGALTIRYNATGTNDLDAITVSNAAGSDTSGTAGTSGYTQNFYADAAKTQLLLTLIAA